MYSKSYFEDSIKHSQLKAKQETLDSLQEHLNPSSFEFSAHKNSKERVSFILITAIFIS